MQTSEQINELAKALAEARAEIPKIDRNREVEVRTKTGGAYKFTYATLDHILDLVVPILSKHGLSLTGGPSIHGFPDPGAEIIKPVSIYTGRIMHLSGQWIEASLRLPEELSPQDIGSALTYFRRYIVCTLLGIAADEDDDGAAAAGNASTGRDRKAPARPQAAPKEEIGSAATGNTYQGFLGALRAAGSLSQANGIADQARPLSTGWTAAEKREFKALLDKQRIDLAVAGDGLDKVLGEAKGPDGELAPNQPVQGLLRAPNGVALPASSTAGECVAFANLFLPKLGSEKWAVHVLNVGGDPKAKDLGVGLDGLRDLCVNLAAAVK